MSRTIGSYVLVSHQSQACSSHRTESCITTRTPLDPAVRRGNLLILKYDEDPLVREKYRQSQRRKTRASTAIRLVREDDSELLLEVGKGSGMQRVLRPCRRTCMSRRPS